MRIYRATITVMLLAFIFSSCGDAREGSSTEEDVIIEQTDQIELPAADTVVASSVEGPGEQTEETLVDLSGLLKSTVDVNFQSIELLELEQVEVKDSWKLTKTQDFGQVNGESVVLSVYQEMDETAMCGSSYDRIVLLEYKKSLFKYEGCGSTSLESEHPELDQAYVKLNYQSTDEGSMIIVGTVDSGSNGPGLMVYYVYDAVQERWYGFDHWGLPSTLDLDGDGTEELVIQFQGLHASPPDISIGRWNGSELVVSPTVKTMLKLSSPYYSAATVEDRDIRVSIDPGEGNGEAVSASYTYNAGRLTRNDER